MRCITEVIYLVFIALLQNKITPPMLNATFCKKSNVTVQCLYLTRGYSLGSHILCYRVLPCDDRKLLFITIVWILGLVIAVQFSHSMAYLLEKKQLVVIFAGKNQEHDSEICPSTQGMLEILWEVWADLCISLGCQKSCFSVNDLFVSSET